MWGFVCTVSEFPWKWISAGFLPLHRRPLLVLCRLILMVDLNKLREFWKVTDAEVTESSWYSEGAPPEVSSVLFLASTWR